MFARAGHALNTPGKVEKTVFARVGHALNTPGKVEKTVFARVGYALNTPGKVEKSGSARVDIPCHPFYSQQTPQHVHREQSIFSMSRKQNHTFTVKRNQGGEGVVTTIN